MSTTSTSADSPSTRDGWLSFPARVGFRQRRSPLPTSSRGRCSTSRCATPTNPPEPSVGDFRHFTRAALAADAGVDPWQIVQSLQAGDPGKIEVIADGVHRAGVAAGEVDGDFENARKRFRDAWVSDGSRSPIDESTEVARIAASVGSHRDELRLIATKYEEIASALAVAQRDASAEIDSLEQQLHTLDAQMNVADRLAVLDSAIARKMLESGKELAIQGVRQAGEYLVGTRSRYAAVLSEASSVLEADGVPLEVPALPAADPTATQATDDLKRLTDQAVLDQMAKVRSIQTALDKAAADAYVDGPGTSEGDAARAKVRDLKGELASALDDLGNIPDYSKVDPKAVTAGADGYLLGDYLVNGQPVQMYGQLKNGTGQIFDQAKLTTYTFKDGKLVGQTRLDAGRVTPDDELLFNAVTAAVGAPELAAGAKVVGEVGVEGFKRLLGREGFDLAASGVTSENVIPKALAGAQLQAEAAQARLSGLPHQLDSHPPTGMPGAGGADDLPPVAAGEHSPSSGTPSGAHPVPGSLDPSDTPPLHTISGPNGELLPAVPDNAIGTPAQNGAGMVYDVAPGTDGLDPRVARVRVMDPVLTGRYPYPDGYVTYENSLGQAVNPLTGKTIGRSDPYWHIPLSEGQP